MKLLWNLVIFVTIRKTGEVIKMNDRSKRTDTVSRIIMAPPHAVYRAFMDPKKLVAWLPPTGMEGGIYRMTLTYLDSDHQTGKTSDNTDVRQGEFLELVPGKRIVQRIVFETEDPAFAGAMTMTWNLDEVPGAPKLRLSPRTYQ